MAREEYVVIDAEEARRRLWPEPAPTRYVAPTQAEAAALERLIAGMLSEPPQARAQLEEAARAAGFALEGWTIAGRRYLAAVAQADHRGGGGAYVVRVMEGGGSGSESSSGSELSRAPPTILQAPHAFFDLGTEDIALELMLAEEGWPRALFVNTVHRYLGSDGVRRKQAASPADPCHSEEHLLARATMAALRALPGAEVVQLHGFGEGQEEATAGPQPAAIVSGGVAQGATPRSRVVAERVRAGLDVAVALFPVDTDRLGATTNVQGRAVRAGGGGFIHIEMSAGLRRRLQADPQARARLAAALRREPAGRP